MSSSRVTKVKYSNTYNYPISLSEYLISEEDGIRSIYLKFYNGVNQTLEQMTFTISEYDCNNNLIRKSKVQLKNQFKENSLFVPKNKFIITVDTVFIKYDLEYAKFSHLVYYDGKFTKQHVNLDVKSDIAIDRKEKVEKLKRKEKKTLKTKNFLVTSLNEKYKARGSNIFVGIFSVILLVFSFILFMNYKNTTNYVTYSSYNYTLGLQLNDADGTCSILKYEGSATNFTIDETYYGYYVNDIADECFMDEELTSLNILGEQTINIGYRAFANTQITELCSSARLIIETESFTNCQNLSYIDCPNAISVNEKAFENCRSLTKVNLSNAYCSKLSFLYCYNINEIFIKDTNARELILLFDEYGDGIVLNLQSVGYFSSQISRGFFDKALKYTTLYNFSYNTNAFVDEGAIPKAYSYGGEFSGR